MEATVFGQLVAVDGLKKYFPVRGGLFSRTTGWIHAVDDVDLTIEPGETLAVVGESGCGKTTLGRVILRLLDPTGGTIVFDGKDITSLPQAEMRRLRKTMQMVFQDPYWSLDPRMLVKDIVAEPLDTHFEMEKKEREERVLGLLGLVGLGADAMRRYPHEFSGGQKQRIGIARALATDPKFLVLDEPTSFLDVSVQAHIINLIRDLQEKLGLTYLFISHNFGVVQHVSDKIAVMYVGKIMESGSVKQVFDEPLHPYTRALMESIPVPDPDVRKGEATLEGSVPSPEKPPLGCRFSTRCSLAFAPCRKEEPELRNVGGGHQVACFLVDGRQPQARKGN
jgi:oligopeptide/dipeptide ABC transporter ATP-binding protein